MDQKKTLEQRFMEAKIALIMNTPDDELDEVLEAGGFEPNDLEQRGKKAVNRVLASLQKDADFITSLPISKRKEIVQQLGIRHAVLDDRKREVNLRCGQIQERDIRIAELTAKLDKARENTKLALSLLEVNDMSDTYLMGNCITLAKQALELDK